MGEVSVQLTPNLGRQVAIKILPDAFAQDPDPSIPYGGVEMA